MSRIEELQNQIRAIEREQLYCNHEYGESKYDPEKKVVGYGYKHTAQGSDVWGDFEGYNEKLIPRWSKTCLKCNKKIYTYDQEPIITGYKPKF